MNRDWATLLGESNPGAARRALGALVAGWQRRRWAHDWENAALEPGVLVVGSPSFGGAGKTPIVELLTRRLRERGANVAIVGHGYRGGNRRTWRATGCVEIDGDEAVELLGSLPGVSLQLGRDRRAAIAAVRDAVDVVLLDGGLGAADVPPAMRILVEDATLPPNVFPAGYCRFRGVDVPGVALRWRHKVDEPGAKSAPSDVSSVWRARHVRAPSGERWPTSVLSEGPWIALSGIARPQSFRFALERAGARLSEHRIFPDHARFPARALALPGGNRGVTTAKDAPRLPTGHCFWVLEGEAVLVAGSDRLELVLDRLLADRLLADRLLADRPLSDWPMRRPSP